MRAKELQDLQRALLAAVPTHHRDAFTERCKSALDLYANGEEGSALETVCENIYDFDVLISPAVHAQLVRLCQRFGVSGELVGLLSEMLRNN